MLNHNSANSFSVSSFNQNSNSNNHNLNHIQNNNSNNSHNNGSSHTEPVVMDIDNNNNNDNATNTPVLSSISLISVNYFQSFVSGNYVNRYSNEKISNKFNACKLKHRTSLKLEDWYRYNYYNLFPQYKSIIYNNLTSFNSISHSHHNELSCNKFIENYEKPKIPLIIHGLTNNWTAMQWTLSRLAKSPYKDCLFKCGEDDEGLLLDSTLYIYIYIYKVNYS